MTKAQGNKKDNKIKSDKTLSKKDKKISKIPNLLVKIPNFEAIKKEYDLTEESLTPIIVLHKMSEVLELYIKIIQQILQPEEFHSMYECGAFDDEDKRKLLILYRKIMFIHRDILKSEILNEENNLLSLIPTIHKEIIILKPVIADIVTKMQKVWELNSKDILKDNSMHYFG